MTMSIVKMTNVTRALGLDQSIIAQPMALAIDLNIDVSVSPMGRLESLHDSLGYGKRRINRVTGNRPTTRIWEILDLRFVLVVQFREIGATIKGERSGERAWRRKHEGWLLLLWFGGWGFLFFTHPRFICRLACRLASSSRPWEPLNSRWSSPLWS
jgi:hypothetical protein